MNVQTVGMQTITTKFLPCTNYKPPRVKAFCDRGEITISWEHTLNSSENHANAVEALIAKFVEEDRKKYGTESGHGWDSGNWIGGWNQKLGVYTFVNIAKL